MTNVTEIKVDSTFVKLMDELRQPDKSVGLIEAGRKNIVVFAERLLGLTPPDIIKPVGKEKYGHIYSWQVYSLIMIQQALESRINPSIEIRTYGGEHTGHVTLKIDDREFVIITSRQIGKSVMLAILSLWCTIYNVIPSGAFNNSNVIIVSASDVQARKLLYEMKKMLMVGDKYIAQTYRDAEGAPMFGEEFFTSMLSKDDPNNTTTISFVDHDPNVHGEFLLAGSKYGSSIKSYPPTASVLGECQIGTDKVLLSNGSYKEIKDIIVGDSVITSDHFRYSTSTVTGLKNNGVKPVIEITTSRGNKVTVTYNHPIMTSRGWVNAENLLITDKIAQITSNVDGQLAIPEEEAKFMGYMLGDGSCNTRTHIKFTQLPGVQKDEFSTICRNMGYSCSWSKDSRGKVYNALVSVKAWDLLSKYGLSEKLSGTKTLPHNFHLWDIKSKALLLNRYFSCDGWFINTEKRPEIGLFSKSESLINGVQHALLSFGIRSNIRLRTKGVFSGYELAIRYNEGIHKFISSIGILGKTEKFKPKENYIKQHSTYDVGGFEFVKVRYINKLSEPQQTFGIQIQGTSCYVSNGILNHNTGGLVIIDEAGMTDRITDQFFYDYLYPVGNSTDAIRVYTSTPWLVSGFFYRLVNPDGIYADTPSQVYLFTIDAIELENPKYHERVMKVVKQLVEDGKKNEVQRAYYCRFVKGESSYFNPEDVYGVFEKGVRMKDSFKEPCDMGVDFGGQVKSKTVITISYLDDKGIARRVFHKIYEVGKDLTLLEDIQQLRKIFNIQRIIVDDCPAGAPYTIKMKDIGWDIQLMNFRAEKVKKYGSFRVMVKREKIKSYEDDGLKTEMLALEFTPGSRQSNIQHAPGYSDDLLDSFLMSCYFYLDDEQKVEFFQW